MRYYLKKNLKEGFGYVIQNKKLIDEDYIEVEPNLLKSYANLYGVKIEDDFDRISILGRTKAEISELLATEEYVIEIDFKLAMLEIMN